LESHFCIAMVNKGHRQSSCHVASGRSVYAKFKNFEGLPYWVGGGAGKRDATSPLHHFSTPEVFG
jgi:hypothetical protein